MCKALGIVREAEEATEETMKPHNIRVEVKTKKAGGVMSEVFDNLPSNLARDVASLFLSPITTRTAAPQTRWPWYRCNICGSRFKGEGSLDIWCLNCNPEYPDVEWFTNPKVNDIDSIGDGTFNEPPPGDECAHPDRATDQLCQDCPRHAESPWCTCYGDHTCEGHRA